MLASSISTYLNRYAVAPGDKLVLFTTNDNATEQLSTGNGPDAKSWESSMLGRIPPARWSRR